MKKAIRAEHPPGPLHKGESKMKITINTGRTMKKQESTTAAYEAPQVEVIEVEVEKGFAQSLPGFDDGGNL